MNRKQIFDEIWAAQDTAYDLMEEYDSLPHHYGTDILFQAEAYIINHIGQTPGITVTELGEHLNKTPSACSQSVKKLLAKGLVEQKRNTDNKRVYNLYLTSTGRQLYQDHIEFNEKCKTNTFQMLADFSEEELIAHLHVQQRINMAYHEDVLRSKKHYGRE